MDYKAWSQNKSKHMNIILMKALTMKYLKMQSGLGISKQDSTQMCVCLTVQVDYFSMHTVQYNNTP
jgi:hypothetical protein